MFLHADTRLEPAGRRALRALPAGRRGGAFRFAVDSPRRGYRVHRGRAWRLRCRLFRLPFGDQGIFARRAAYDAVGGFPPLPLMEDVDFVRRLGGRGAWPFPRARLHQPAAVGAAGFVATTLRNWRLLALYAAGRSPERLARLYGDQR